MPPNLSTTTQQAVEAMHTKPQGSWIFIGGSDNQAFEAALWLLKSLHGHATTDLACVRCKQINSTAHPDIHILQPSESGSIGISETHKVVHSLSETRNDIGMIFRAVIIKSAHAMTIEAQNALLKTLEEPPADSIIVLITHDVTKLLETVRSRSRTIWFGEADRADANDEISETLSLSAFDKLARANSYDGVKAQQLVRQSQSVLSKQLRQADAADIPKLVIHQQALERLQRNLSNNVTPKTAVSAFLLELT